MTNREAIEYASKHSFLELFNKGKEAGREELIARCNEADIDNIPFPSQLIRNIADQIGNVNDDYESISNKGVIEELRTIRKELIDSELCTFSQVIDFISDKIALLEGENVGRFMAAGLEIGVKDEGEQHNQNT